MDVHMYMCFGGWLIFDLFALDDRRRMKVKLTMRLSLRLRVKTSHKTSVLRGRRSSLVFSKRERDEWRAQFWISTNNKRKRRSTHQKQNETKLVKTADESRRRIQSNRLLLTPFAIDSLAVQFDGGRVASSADYGGTTWNYGQIPGYFSVVSAI